MTKIRCALTLLACAMASIAGAAELAVQVTVLGGGSAEGATVEVAGAELVRQDSSEGWVFELPGEMHPMMAPVSVALDGHVPYSEMRLRGIAKVELCPLDPKLVDVDELPGVAREYGRLLGRLRRAAVVAGDVAPAARLAAFFEDGPARGDVPQMPQPDFIGPNNATVTVTLVDNLGRPVGGRGVELLLYNEETRQVERQSRERSGPDGVATFVQVPPGLLCRLLASDEGDGLVAASSFFTPGRRGRVAMEPLVLRPRHATLSGVVVAAGGPAAGWNVVTEGGGQPSLQARTDEHGYFQLGPLQPGAVELTIAQRALGFSWPVPVQERSAVIPIHFVMQMADNDLRQAEELAAKAEEERAASALAEAEALKLIREKSGAPAQEP